MSEDSAPKTDVDISNVQTLEDVALNAEEQDQKKQPPSKSEEKKRAKKKKLFKLGLVLGGVLILTWAVNWLFFTKTQGSMAYGICKIFLETNSPNIRYADTLRISSVEELGASVRIWYTHIDGFGEYKLESLQCVFRKDETLGFILDRVSLNRRPPMDQSIIDRFNKILPMILSMELDLTMPRALEDSLKNLQIDRNMFRRPIL